MSSVSLELTSVGKIFKKNVIIENISLKVKKGQVIALIGHSGSGKTTILQIAGLLDKPTSGIVAVDGINCTRASDKRKTYIRRNFLSFIYQFHYLLQELSVLENIMLPQLIAGKGKAVAMKSALTVLEKFSLENKADNMVSEISGGERQRVAIARSIVSSPRLLLADEPTGNLDSINSLSVFSLLHSYVKENNSSMIIVTHNHLLAERADYVLQIKNRSLIKL
ncbi:ATP-binding cassette domain-containing protein [Wolbachia endosymbiont of Cruorifilaria tuberocauda]|uniref:ABC transporter ATP-binding protein n=1 Tax=Wolbachia endosymbiont of Cruorifilaria tuberocauda TaxID=1812111 RepID=UPI001589C653|nr:ABC transporter ATP-binding protein [Wolbachia endosymbiont of Cruorifilaria tuberocauda]QKX01830.1 ATP-binding cassette domain-containing protein [Wolbachia endosymbiont of Cruorifilaria tuberocauda]